MILYVTGAGNKNAPPGRGEGRSVLAIGSSVQVMPIQGGGRGPVINNGQVITTELLQSLLADVISEVELSPALRARLDAFDSRLTALEP